MVSSAKTFQTLVIIGNGFDMAHGYHTDYQSFVEKNPDSNLNWFRSYCENDASITTWYFFEENIKILTNKLFFKRVTEDYGCNDILNEGTQLKHVYQEIQRLLIQYLKSESLRKPIVKLSSVEKYLNEKAKAINFNYTRIAEAYTSDVFYIHGSLNENDIVLGYDYRDEACLMEYEDMRFSKILCRQGLSFRRFLRQECGLNSESEEYRRLISGFESYQRGENSGRGIDEELKKSIPNYRFIEQFMKNYRVRNDIPDMDYKRISMLVVMGHGIEADQVFLKEIVSKCVNLQEVIVFRYRGEDEDSIKKKMQFFEPFCSNVGFEYYI